MTGATPKLTSPQPSIAEARAIRELLIGVKWPACRVILQCAVITRVDWRGGLGWTGIPSRLGRVDLSINPNPQLHLHKDEGHGGVEAVQRRQRADGPAQPLPRLCSSSRVWGM